MKELLSSKESITSQSKNFPVLSFKYWYFCYDIWTQYMICNDDYAWSYLFKDHYNQKHILIIEEAAITMHI